MSEAVPKAPSVKKRLSEARRAMVAARIVLGSLNWSAVVMGVWLLLFVLDNLVRLPSGLRFPLAICALALCVRGLLRSVLKPALKRQTMQQTAVLLEQKHDIRRNVIINAYELEQRQLEGIEGAFAQQTLKTGGEQMAEVPIGELWEWLKVAKLGVVALALAVLWGTYLSVAPAQAGNAAVRFGLPLADVPPLGAVTLTLDPPDHVSVVQGDNLEIRVLVQLREGNPEGEEEMAIMKALPRIVLRPGEKLVSSAMDRDRAVTMAPWPRQDVMAAISERSGEHPSPGMLDAHGTEFEKLACRDDIQAYIYTVTNLKRPLSLRVYHEQGGTYTKALRVGVRIPPKIKGSQFHLTPPEYTGVDTVSMLGPPHAVSGLKGSKLRIEVEPDRKVEGLSWIANGESVPFEKKKGIWYADTVLSESGPYEVASESKDIGRPAPAAIGGIVIRDDMPPRIDFATTNRSQAAIPGEKIQLKVQASDDFGIADVEVYMRSALGGGGSELIKSWTFGAPPGRQGGFQEEFVLELHPSTFMPGAEYVLEALCHDYHPRRQQGRSRPFLLRIQDVTAAEVFEEDKEMASAMEELDRAIELQQLALASTRNLQTYLVDALGLNEDGGARRYTLPAHEAKIWGNQLNVRKALQKLVQDVPKPKPDFINDVRKLVDNEASAVLESIPGLRAVEHAIGDAESTIRDRFPESNRWQKKTCRPVTGRYVGLVGRNSNRHGSEIAIAEFALLKENGVAYPRKFVQSWQLGKLKKPWSGDAFVDLPRAERNRIQEQIKLAPMEHFESSFIDYQQALQPPHENVAAYAYRKIKAARTRTLRLLVGSDDAIRVWLNDELIISALENRSAEPDQNSAVIELIEGDNDLLIEVSNGSSDFGLICRFAEEDGTPLGLSADGHLSPVPNLRVAFFDSVDQGFEPEAAIDELTSTAWVTTYKEMPHGIFFDLGQSLPIGGFRYKPQDSALENWIRTFDFYVLDELRSSQSLPAPLRAIERQQSFILDQLVAIRGTEVKKVATVAHLQGDLRNEAAPTPDVTASAAIDDFYTEVRTFAAEVRQLAAARKQILDDAGGDVSAEDLDALEEMRFKEARLAKSLDRAVQEMKELANNIELVDSDQAAELNKIIETAEELSLQAEAGVRRKAEDETADVDEDEETLELADNLLEQGPPDLTPEPEPEVDPDPDSNEGLAAALDAIFEELAIEQEEVAEEFVAAVEAAGVNTSRQVDALGGTGEAPAEAAAQTGTAPQVPAALQGQMQRSAAAQAEVRESAEEVRMRLTAHNLQNANLDAAIAAMEQAEAAAASGNLFEMRRAFTEAATLANAASRSIGRSTGMQKMQGRLDERSGAGSHVAGRSAPPKGYEHMVGAYFKKLAESQ